MLRQSSTTVCVVVAACLGFAASGIIGWLGATSLPDGPLAQHDTQHDSCVRPEPGSEISEPQELRSHDGVLEVDLAIDDQKLPDGTTRYCYLTSDGKLSPTLRLRPGDQLVIRLKNDLIDYAAATPELDPSRAQSPGSAPICTAKKAADPCSSGAMTPVSTNLHFHGLTAPPVCHQDDVLKTSIQPEDPPFEYRLRIPDDEPPGSVLVSPAHSRLQQDAGARRRFRRAHHRRHRAGQSVAGRSTRARAGDPRPGPVEPRRAAAKSEPVVPKNLLDSDGDAANNGTGFGKPAKDLSVNFVPVPYPDYPPATLTMKPGERQLWRVLNASAITYLESRAAVRRVPQPLGIVAIDGVPIHFQRQPGTSGRNGSITSACRPAPASSSSSKVRRSACPRCW